MRLLILVTLLCYGSAYAEENPAIACNQQLATQPKFAPIASKLPLGGMSDVSFEQLAIKAIPTKKESKLISDWVTEGNTCFNLGLDFANKNNVLPQIIAIATEAHNREKAVAAGLFNREFSYGAANKKIQAIVDDLRNKIAAVNEQNAQTKKTQDAQDEAARENNRRYAEQRQAQAAEDEKSDRLRKLMLFKSLQTPTVPYQFPRQPVTSNCFVNGNLVTCNSY